MTLGRDLVLDVANQVGGVSPGTATLKDWSRYGANGTMTNITWTQLSSGLWVMNFDGTARVALPNTPAHNMGNSVVDVPFTLAFWMYPSSSIDRTVIGKIDFAGARQWLLNMSSEKLILWWYDESAGAYLGSKETDNVVLNTWAFYAITYDASEAVTGVSFYKDGVAVADTDISGGGAYVAMESNSIGIDIGCRENGGKENFFYGYIGPLQVYRYALTSAQIRAYYHSQKWLFGVIS